MLYNIVDGNSIGFAANSATSLRAGNLPTQAINGMLRKVREIVEMFGAESVIILWDGKSWRKEVSMDYKANREANPKMVQEREQYRIQRPYISRGLRLLGVSQIVAQNMEADDLAGKIVPQLVSRGNQVRLVTGDRDWLQLIQKGVTWTDHRSDKRCNLGNFTEVTGFRNSREFVQGKALQGDASDNIKGVGGIGEKGAKDLLKCFGSVEAFLNETRDYCLKVHNETLGKNSKDLPKAWRTFADDQEAQERFYDNMRLMDLASPHVPKPVGLTQVKQPLDLDGFRAFCGEVAFHSVLNDMDRFIAPFYSMEKAA